MTQSTPATQQTEPRAHCVLCPSPRAAGLAHGCRTRTQGARSQTYPKMCHASVLHFKPLQWVLNIPAHLSPCFTLLLCMFIAAVNKVKAFTLRSIICGSSTKHPGQTAWLCCTSPGTWHVWLGSVWRGQARHHSASFCLQSLPTEKSNKPPGSLTFQ